MKRLKVPIISKGMSKGVITQVTHRPGCKLDSVQRNPSNPGEYILWFGTRRYAVIDAVKLHDTVDGL